MSKQLIDGVNEVLKRVNIVRTGALLTGLTDDGKQGFIDLAVQAWNEAVDQLYSKADVMKPYQADEGQITLVADQRAYALNSDLVQIRWPLHDETNGRYISEYPGGYEELRHSQSIPGQYDGQPFTAAISPKDGKELYLDSNPTSDEAGDVYKYLYWKDTELDSASDYFPFDDAVFRAMVPVVTEVWKLIRRGRSSSSMSKINYGRALRLVKQQPPKPYYKARHQQIYGGPLGFDPLDG